jgi:hypothetical protein
MTMMCYDTRRSSTGSICELHFCMDACAIASSFELHEEATDRVVATPWSSARTARKLPNNKHERWGVGFFNSFHRINTETLPRVFIPFSSLFIFLAPLF